MKDIDSTKKLTGFLAIAIVLCIGFVLIFHWRGNNRQHTNLSRAAESAVAQKEAVAQLAAARRPPPQTAPQSMEKSSEKDKNYVPSADEWGALARRNQYLEQENLRLKGRLEDMLNWILENVQGTYPLPEHLMANLRILPMTEEGTVSEDLMDFLRLSETEAVGMDNAFFNSYQVLQDVEAVGIYVEEQPEDGIATVNIPPYPAEGAMIREDLYNALEDVLGRARFHRLLEVAGEGLNEQFGYFGEASRQLHFTLLESGDGSADQIFVRDEWVIPSNDPTRQDVRAREEILNVLPAEYLGYLAWLPEYVSRFATTP